jgi:hypothetical protein
MPGSTLPPTDSAGMLARQLAVAAHWGLEDVPIPPPPNGRPSADGKAFLNLPAAQDFQFNLEPYGDVLGHTCNTPAGILGSPLRMLRGLFKFVMGPWLDIQTLHNQAVLKTLLHEQASGRTYLSQVAAHIRNQQRELTEVYDRLDRCTRELDGLKQVQRVSIRHVVEALEQMVVRNPPAEKS